MLELKRVKHPLIIKSDGTPAGTELSVGDNLLKSVEDVAIYINKDRPNSAVLTINLTPLYIAVEDIGLIFNLPIMNNLNRKNTINQLEKLVARLKKIDEESK